MRRTVYWSALFLDSGGYEPRILSDSRLYRRKCRQGHALPFLTLARSPLRGYVRVQVRGKKGVFLEARFWPVSEWPANQELTPQSL